MDEIPEGSWDLDWAKSDSDHMGKERPHDHGNQANTELFGSSYCAFA